MIDLHRKQRRISSLSEMTTHRKQRTGGAFTASCGADVGETKTRLRFANKKPLCLQYNNPNSAQTKRLQLRTKRKEPSFIYTVLVGVAWLLRTCIASVQKEVVEFLLKPVDESYYTDFEKLYSNCCATTQTSAKARLRRRTSKSKMMSQYLKDYGRTARIRAYQDRCAELCVF